MALATVTAGRGDAEQLVKLPRIVYLAFFLQDETTAGANVDLYRQAEAALDSCIERAERVGNGYWSIASRPLSNAFSLYVMNSCWLPCRGIAILKLGIDFSVS